MCACVRACVTVCVLVVGECVCSVRGGACAEYLTNSKRDIAQFINRVTIEIEKASTKRRSTHFKIQNTKYEIFCMQELFILTRYLLMTLEEVMLKNTNPDSVATAFANNVFPVPIGKIISNVSGRL